MATVLYVGTENGVKTVRSQEDSSWELTSGKMPSCPVEALAVVPSRPNVVLAGTRGDGVWVSEDSGLTFSKPCRGKAGPGKVRSLAIDPQNENRVYAGCEPIDLFVSDDLGKNWERVESVWDVPWVATVTYPGRYVEPHVRDIAIDPSDPNTIYIALQVGYILKTTDRGKTWKLLNKGLDTDVHTLAIDPTNTNRIVIATGGSDSHRGITNNGKALFSSEDAGETWIPLATDFDQEYAKQLIFKPGQPEVAYTALAHGNPGDWRERDSGAEGIMIRTKDGGQSWEQIDLSSMPDSGQTMVAVIAPDKNDPEHLYAAFDDGEFISSTNGGDSWTKMGVQLLGTNDMKCVSV